MTMKKFAIIVAGGTGSRLGGEIPKQFLLLGGKPLLMHSIEIFYQYDPTIHIIVAMHPAYTGKWTELCAESHFMIPHQLAPGGETRFHSVRNALALVSGNGLVAVHDAARPLATVDLVIRTFQSALEHGSAIPCIPVNETVRSVENGRVNLIDRASLRITQTPEVFDIALLRNAYEQPYCESFTDDGSVLEATGRRVHLVDGEPTNLKVTLPGDIEVAEVLLKRL
jgi:2-C-methyl-D-erythritol 4-phosphate cytidylyltransferase